MYAHQFSFWKFTEVLGQQLNSLLWETKSLACHTADKDHAKSL